MSYNFNEIEKKWQKYWDENKTFYTDVWDFSNLSWMMLGVYLRVEYLPNVYKALCLILRIGKNTKQTKESSKRCGKKTNNYI